MIYLYIITATHHYGDTSTFIDIEFSFASLHSLYIMYITGTSLCMYVAYKGLYWSHSKVSMCYNIITGRFDINSLGCWTFSFPLYM